jgi:hypothetical protein
MILRGYNWSIDKTITDRPVVTVFDQTGYVLDDKTWRMPGCFGEVEVKPLKLGEALCELIKDFEGEVKLIIVASHYAVGLMLEGVVTAEALQASLESPFSIILDVVLEGRCYQLAIMPEILMTGREVELHRTS